eukprot:Hpha_TRINITY_DN32740_c0_g1::TRINITY_DN32740_c0_g1_i1::g.69228::m.69228
MPPFQVLLEWAPVAVSLAAGHGFFQILAAEWRVQQMQVRETELRGQIRQIRREERDRQSAHEDEMRTQTRLRSDVDGKMEILERLWAERTRRVKAEAQFCSECGDALETRQWEVERAAKWLDLAAFHCENQKQRGNLARFEITSGRMNALRLAMPNESHDEAVRTLSMTAKLKHLRSVAFEDPLFLMLEASLSHLELVPELGGPKGLSAEYEQLLARAMPFSPEMTAHGMKNSELFVKKDLQVAHAVTSRVLQDVPADNSELVSDLKMFKMRAEDHLLARQALQVADAYLATLQLPLAQTRTM